MKKSKEQILNDRAAKLAKMEEHVEKNHPHIEAVIFALENERYAIEASFTQEIFNLKDVTFLPHIPSFIYGLINVRRKVIAVINLKNIFDIESTSPFHKAIILQNATTQFAISIDAVEGIEKIFLNEIQPPIPTLTGIRQEILKGLTKEGLAVLDGEKLLSHKKIMVYNYV